MSKKHLFIMDSEANLNLELDSTVRIMHELSALGHLCYHTTPQELSWNARAKSAEAKARRAEFPKGPEGVIFTGESSVELADCDAIHMRKDPPYDMDYITCTWLMDSASQHARIYNSPASLRNLNEKLAILLFPDSIAPALVSSDVAEISAFIQNEAHGDAIIKPLTLYGGRGIERLKDLSESELKTKLLELTDNGKSLRLFQPFNSAIGDGEIRVFTAFGEPISWCLKRPKDGDFLANTRAGATLEAYHPSVEMDDMVRDIAGSLMLEGVVFIGFDIIGHYISEINITSPRMLVPPGDKTNYYGKIASLIAKDLA